MLKPALVIHYKASYIKHHKMNSKPTSYTPNFVFGTGPPEIVDEEKELSGIIRLTLRYVPKNAKF